VNFFLDNDVPVELGRMLQLKGHSVEILKEVLPRDTDDLSALRHAANKGMIVITCNRRDFLKLAESEPRVGIIILVRRRTRIAECASVLRLLARADESGICNNINFA
jgi:predicted nuclease of predicted toxin-antitoxin system